MPHAHDWYVERDAPDFLKVFVWTEHLMRIWSAERNYLLHHLFMYYLSQCIQPFLDASQESKCFLGQHCVVSIAYIINTNPRCTQTILRFCGRAVFLLLLRFFLRVHIMIQLRLCCVQSCSMRKHFNLAALNAWMAIVPSTNPSGGQHSSECLAQSAELNAHFIPSSPLSIHEPTSSMFEAQFTLHHCLNHIFHKSDAPYLTFLCLPKKGSIQSPALLWNCLGRERGV